MSEPNESERARLPGIDPDSASENVRTVFESQRKKWGAPLTNHLVYARCPEIFQGARGMWHGLDASGRIEGQLTALLNRRVALLNGCVF